MTDTENLPALPAGWCWTTIREIAFVISGQTPKGINEIVSNGEIPFYKISDMNRIGNEKYMVESEITLSCKDIKDLKLKIQNKETIIFPKRGGAILTNKKRILSRSSAYDLNIMGISPIIISYKLIYYWSSKIDLSMLADGSNIPQINHKDIEPLYFPLPPLPEQHRIVQKIEELFTDLDAGVQELEKAKVQIKNYKQAVLKAAVNGSLSEGWREENKNRLECTPKNGSYKKSELTEENSKLPFIPAEWSWTTLNQIGELSRGKSKHRPRDDPVLYDGSYPFIQTGDVRGANGLLLKYTQTYSEKGLHQSRLWPKGTLCITIAANIADTAILGFDACFPDSVVGFISNTSICETKFIEYFVRTAKEDLDRYAPATAQKNINLKILSNLYVPLPPLEEQKVIVYEIERRFSVIDQIEKTVDQSLIQAEKLRQAILKKAFKGKLVPQNSNDEPASVLLERIKQEKGRAETREKPGKKTKVKAETVMEISGKTKQAELF